MNKKSLVSVIVPVYNAESYIDRCIESICHQSYRELEILLMVGKCSDASLEHCTEWQKKDDRIIVVSRKDNSLGDARNYALNLAQGKYLIYVDADDYLDKYFVDKMITPLEEDESIDISCCGFNRFANDEKIFFDEWLPGMSGSVEMNFQKYMETISYGTVWLKAYRRQWILDKKIYMFDGCHEDDAMHICLSATVEKMYFVNEPLYHYNVGNGNSLIHSSRHFSDFPKAMVFAMDYLIQNNYFEANRMLIRRYLVNVTESMRNLSNNNEEYSKIGLAHFNGYFPEVYEEELKVKNIQKTESIILFGAGADGKQFLAENRQASIKYIIDNNPSLWGQEIEGIKVISFDDFLKAKEDSLIVVASRNYFYDIALQLREHHIYNYISAQEYYLMEVDSNRKEKNIVLLLTPTHDNVGDHAIAECEKLFLAEKFPEYGVLEYTEADYARCRYKIRERIDHKDVIIITGGGYLGTLWMSAEELVRKIICDFPNNKIIIFPQSLFYENTPCGKEQEILAKKIYGRHSDLTLILREKYSYDRAKEIFADTVRCELLPDIVLSLKPNKKDMFEKINVGLCLKRDKEGVLSEGVKTQIKAVLEKQKLSYIETSMKVGHHISMGSRWMEIEQKIIELSSYKFVITDALHCMIFCAISGIPCIALDNVSRKLSGIYEWIKELSYIKFAMSIEQIDSCVAELKDLGNQEYTFDYEPYAKSLEKLFLERE